MPADPGTSGRVAATPGFPPAPRGRSAFASLPPSPVVEVTDPDDPRVEVFSDLRTPDRRADWERRRGLCTLEGLHALEALLSTGRVPLAVLIERRWLERLPALDAPVLVASRSVLAAVTGFDFHRGLLAVAERPAAPALADLVRDAPRLLVVEGVNDPENLGSLYRNAAAFGVDGVVLDPTAADHLARRVVRVSSGHVLRLPTARAVRWPEDLDEVTRSGHEVWALTPAATTTVADLGRRRPPRWALVVGAEGPGLGEATTARATGCVRVPMAPGVDSLNVATAAAVALHRLTAP